MLVALRRGLDRAARTHPASLFVFLVSDAKAAEEAEAGEREGSVKEEEDEEEDDDADDDD